MGNDFSQYAFMESMNIKYTIVEPKYEKRIKTGVCSFCGSRTSKKSKCICNDCSAKRIALKYKNKNG